MKNLSHLLLRWSTSGSHYIITLTITMGFVNICTMMKMVVIMMICFIVHGNYDDDRESVVEFETQEELG